jgi:uncharacterized protein
MLIVIILGFLFGVILQYSRLNRYNTISGMAMMKDLTMAKAIAVAIGLGMIIINIAVYTGLASYHIKPLLLTGVVIGGLIFGVGMAILGYCPGTMPVSMGEGSLDAFTGFFGGLAGGIVYTLVQPSVKSIIGPDLGKTSLFTALGENHVSFFIIVAMAGILLVGIAFLLNRLENGKNYKWLISGIGLALLTVIISLKSVTNTAFGASSTYPYVGGLVAGLGGTDYFKSVTSSGNWQMHFLGGAFLSGLILSLIRKDFRFTLIHENWRKYKGDSGAERLIWAFVAGFMLIFGARMAGGCTSGHIIAGGVQLASSSWLFAIFTFGAFLLTGRLFYKK